jgi:hypothetical protein
VVFARMWHRVEVPQLYAGAGSRFVPGPVSVAAISPSSGSRGRARLGIRPRGAAHARCRGFSRSAPMRPKTTR